MCQTLDITNCYRVARAHGYQKNKPVDYVTMTKIIAKSYELGYEKAKSEANKKPQS